MTNRWYVGRYDTRDGFEPISEQGPYSLRDLALIAANNLKRELVQRESTDAVYLFRSYDPVSGLRHELYEVTEERCRSFFIDPIAPSRDQQHVKALQHVISIYDKLWETLACHPEHGVTMNGPLAVDLFKAKERIEEEFER